MYMQNSLSLINIDNLDEIKPYPLEFINFCKDNNLIIPKINTGRGKALSAMLNNIDKYFDRKTCIEFCNKFNINSDDSIQLFNKHEQIGIKTSDEKGKYYIKYPYCLSNKHKMRKNFGYNLTEEEKNNEINKIKATIKNDYLDVPNEKWQLGHKNPESNDNNNNLILQPPIQAKYRDRYIFIDTLTKIPTPNEISRLIKTNNCPYTIEQLIELKNLIDIKLNEPKKLEKTDKTLDEPTTKVKVSNKKLEISKELTDKTLDEPTTKVKVSNKKLETSTNLETSKELTDKTLDDSFNF